MIAKYWKTLDDGRVKCELCPRGCALRDGQRGFCFVRSARDGALHLDTYGRSSGFAMDPIEKKPLFHFLPSSQILSFGTAGCNLNCRFCQNWDISKAREFDRLAVEASPSEIAAFAAARGAKSVAFTYNDPVIFAEYAIDTALACREVGILAVAVTAGYISPGAREDFFRVMDGANIDLKGFSEDYYWHQTGAHLKDVLETIAYVAGETSCWTELTTLLIPGLNDSTEEITELTRWVRREIGPDVPIHFSAFHPDWKLRNIPRTPPETLARAREIALGQGLHFVYTGNVRDLEGGATICPNCGEMLVVRDWFEVLSNRVNVTNGVGFCSSCNAPIPGVW